MILSIMRLMDKSHLKLKRHVVKVLAVLLLLGSGIAHAYQTDTDPIATPTKRPNVRKITIDWPHNQANLSTVLTYALAHHPELSMAKAQKRAAEHTLRATKGGLLPKVDAELAYGYEYNDNPLTRFSDDSSVSLLREERVLQIRQLVYDGGKVWNRVKRDRSALDASEHATFRTRENLSLRIVRAYLAILRFRERLHITQVDLNSHRQSIQKIKLRQVRQGARKSELELSQSRLVEAKARYTVAKMRLQEAQNIFVQEVGKMPPKFLAKTPEYINQIPQNLVLAKTQATKHNPALAVARSNVTAAGHNIAALQANFLPDVSVDLETSYNNQLDGVQGQNSQSLALIYASYNLYNGGTDRANIKHALEQRNSALDALADENRDVTESVATAWVDMKKNLIRYHLLQKNTADAKIVFESYVGEFASGERDLFDVLNAQNEYYQTHISLIDAHFNYLLSEYRLLEAMGMLSSSIL